MSRSEQHRRWVAVTTLVGLISLSLHCTAAPSEPVETRGFWVVPAGEGELRFTPWASEDTAQQAIQQLRRVGGGTLRFLPGVYEIEKGLEINDTSNIHLEGGPEVTFQFPPAPVAYASLTAAVRPGDDVLQIDHPERLQEGRRYQVYARDYKGDRTLEFRVTGFVESGVKISPKVHFMGHVKSIDAGSWIIPQVNFLYVNRSDSISVTGIRFDGGNRGQVHGHTTYCGILAVGHYKPGERPTSHDLKVEQCTFLGLKGRGIAAYGIKDVQVRRSSFFQIDSQAIEIDHFSSGTVVHNAVRSAGVGVALNDAFESTVAFNTLTDCATGVAFVKHFPQEWVNTGNLVEHNVFIRPHGTGGISFQKGIAGNTLRGNQFLDCPPKKQIVGGEGNDLDR